MPLTYRGSIELPAHVGQGGFDHADVLPGRARVYVAHTANDALDVIDTEASRFSGSIPGLKGVAGVLVSPRHDLIFASNRGEDTVAILSPMDETPPHKIPTVVRPNGLAYDPGRDILLVAGVGDGAAQDSASATLIHAGSRTVLGSVPMPGRTRWAMFDEEEGVFFVNIATPSAIVVVAPSATCEILRRIDVPARGPHGLALDGTRRRLLCACDDGWLVAIDSRSGIAEATLRLSGAPDVVFLNQAIHRLYVAVGDPGVIDVIDTEAWELAETVETESGAHTMAYDPDANRVYAFLNRSHSAAVFEDS